MHNATCFLSLPTDPTKRQSKLIGPRWPIGRRFAQSLTLALLLGTGCLGQLPSAVAQSSTPNLRIGGAQVGQTYALVRRRLMAAGLTPVPQTGDDRCSGRPVCKSYPEAGSCIGTGNAACWFVFRDRAGRIITVGTIGDERGAPGREIGLDLSVDSITFDRSPFLQQLAKPKPTASSKGDASSRRSFEGLWGRDAAECADEEGPNNRTLIDLRNVRGDGSRIALFDQYENHCRITEILQSGRDRVLRIRCHEFWQQFDNKESGTDGFIKLSPGPRGTLMIDGARYMTCQKPSP